MRDHHEEPREHNGAPEGGEQDKDTATAGVADARHPRTPAPLPLAARRALWDRVWDRLLVAPPVEPGSGPDRDPSEATPAQSPTEKGGAR